MGQSYNRDVCDGGMAGKRIFHFARVDVEAAGDDHLLVAANNIKVALRVEAAEVAGIVPAVTHGFSDQLGPAPEHDLADALVFDGDLADLADVCSIAAAVVHGDLGVRDRPATGT